jgi:ribonuclease P protein component
VPKRQFSFSKEQRLLSALEFKKAIGSPVAKLMNDALVMYVAPNEANAEGVSTPRLGIAIAKRHIKKAVERNTIKRVLRESFRLQSLNLPPLMIVIMSRRDLLGFDKAGLHQKIEALWIQLQQKFPGVCAPYA